MSFFKTRIEREMMQQMQREEQMQVFSDQINSLKVKRQEYARIAAEAEVNGDSQTYDVSINALIMLNDTISNLTQTKANFDIITISNSIATNMAMAVNALDAMANGKSKMPDIRKISKTSIKVKKYMAQIQMSQKTMGRLMNNTNPANKSRSSEDLQAVRPMIDAEISRLVGSASTGLGSSARNESKSMDLSSEILKEKNRII
jgi:hypothetical protein